MKLLKTKSVKRKILSETVKMFSAVDVDSLAEDYESVREDVKIKTETLGNISSLIKREAEKGKVSGKLHYLKGKKYKVGYYLCDGTPRVDEDAAKRFLTLRQMRLVAINQVSMPLLAQAVEEGKISPATLAKIVTVGEPVKRITVTRLGNHE
jgi:hypothetical protein